MVLQDAYSFGEGEVLEMIGQMQCRCGCICIQSIENNSGAGTNRLAPAATLAYNEQSQNSG